MKIKKSLTIKRKGWSTIKACLVELETGSTIMDLYAECMDKNCGIGHMVDVMLPEHAKKLGTWLLENAHRLGVKE